MFGVAWATVLKQRRVLNALMAGKKLCVPETLLAELWQKAEATKRVMTSNDGVSVGCLTMPVGVGKLPKEAAGRSPVMVWRYGVLPEVATLASCYWYLAGITAACEPPPPSCPY